MSFKYEIAYSVNRKFRLVQHGSWFKVEQKGWKGYSDLIFRTQHVERAKEIFDRYAADMTGDLGYAE